MCCLCKRELPLSDFHRSRQNGFSSRCENCHGLALRRCGFCGLLFIGKPSRKACTRLCRELMRSPTFLLCGKCSQLFGPVDHLDRRYCSRACKNAAAATGRTKIRRTMTKARSAQSLLRYHVQAGNIIRPITCEECGAADRPIEGAHFNYDEPLRVRWLCVSCHRRWDKCEPKNATFVVSSAHGKEETAT